MVQLGPNFQIVYQGSKDLMDLGDIRATADFQELIGTFPRPLCFYKAFFSDTAISWSRKGEML